jgi:hypothetical protein
MFVDLADPNQRAPSFTEDPAKEIVHYGSIKLCRQLVVGWKMIHATDRLWDLARHFRRRHLSTEKEFCEHIIVRICELSLNHKRHLQNRAMLVHGAVLDIMT